MRSQPKAPKPLAQLILKKLYMHPEGIAGASLWAYVQCNFPGFSYVDYNIALDLLREQQIAISTNRRWWLRDGGAHSLTCACKICLETRKAHT